MGPKRVGVTTTEVRPELSVVELGVDSLPDVEFQMTLAPGSPWLSNLTVKLTVDVWLMKIAIEDARMLDEYEEGKILRVAEDEANPGELASKVVEPKVEGVTGTMV
jgi:hypothetical protein